MLRGAAVAFLALAAAAEIAPLRAQSRLRAGFGAGAGFVRAVGDTRASYSDGPGIKGELAFGMTGSPWSARLEVWYLRLEGRHSSDVRFPALNLLAFSASAVRRLGAAGRPFSPYLMAGAGPQNLQDALPFASYHTRLGLHAGAGTEYGRGRLRAYVDARATHVTSQPPTNFVLLSTGVRWAL